MSDLDYRLYLNWLCKTKDNVNVLMGIKKWQTGYRTATTDYPCFLPDLGDSTGAGRIDLPLQS